METTGNEVRDALQEVNNEGKFIRSASGFRHIINKQHEIFTPDFDRYHLYISLACPWAHRCYMVLKLKGLDSCIQVTIVHPTWNRTRPNDENDTHCGWLFTDRNYALSSSAGYGSFSFNDTTLDTLNGAKSIRDLYELSGDTLKKYSVPVLWDKKTKQIVNNESSEIIRMLGVEFDAFATGLYANVSFYPDELRAKIDEMNELVYDNINDGVYKCGFAKSQLAYDEAVVNLYSTLEKVEVLLSTQRYLLGNIFTEADIRLFVTLLRFDEVYVVYFKCNIREISSYSNLLNYCRDIYQIPGVKESIGMNHIKTHYFSSHPTLNAYAIIPRGPDCESLFAMPHDRSKF